MGPRAYFRVSKMTTDDLTRLIERGFANFLGIEVVSATRDKVTGQMEIAPNHLNENGKVHGGVIMAFADTLGGCGTMLNLPAGGRTATLESKTNFFSATGPGVMTGESIPLHVGRTTMVWQTSVFGADGKRIAVVTQTQMVLDQGA